MDTLSSASERHIGEDKRPQLRILAMMIVRYHISVGGAYARDCVSQRLDTRNT